MGYRTATRCAGMILLLCVGSRAWADGPDNAFADIAGRWYVSPAFALVDPDGRRGTGDGSGWSVAVGKNVNRYVNVEIYGHRTRYDALEGNARDSSLEGFGIAVAGFPLGRRDDGWGTVLGGAHGLIGVGYAEARDFPRRGGRFDSNGSRFVLDAGVGYLLRIPFIRAASLRVDARYRLDIDRHPYASVEHDQENDDPEFGDAVVSLGLLIPIGARPKAEPTPRGPEVVSPIDGSSLH